MIISTIDTDGGKLAVAVEGAGPLVICSHGLGDNRDAFGPLSAFLVDAGYRVACLDLRGHGESTAHFKRYGDEPTADDLLTVIDALGGGPAVLVGASLSAAAAVIAAGRRPEKVAGLVLLGPFLRNSAGPGMVWLLGVLLKRPWGPSVWRGYATKLWPGLGDEAKKRAATTTSLLTRPERWTAFQATSAGADHSVVAPWLARVHAPVLVVMGDADPDWKDPLAEAKWVASNFKDVETIAVSGAGHAPMFERPKIVGPAMLRFLKRIRFDGVLKPSVAA